MEVMFVLLLYMNDNLKEWMGHYENDAGQWVEMGVSGCLSMKRTLKEMAGRTRPQARRDLLARSVPSS